MLIEQLIDLRKVKTENLKYSTDLQDQVLDDRSATQLMIFCEEIAKEIFQ